MANQVAITGNLGKDPELRYAASGTPLCKFSVAVWQGKDKGAAWTPVVVFGQYAENVAESFGKGDTVICVGRLSLSEWETEDGEKRSRLEMIADEVGPSLRWSTCTINRAERSEQTSF